MLSIVLVSCEDEGTGSTLKNYNYVSLEVPSSKTFSLYPNESITTESKVYVTYASSVDRTFALVVDMTLSGTPATPATTLDASYYTVPATVTIPAGELVGTFTVGITGTNIGAGKKLVVGLGQEVGVDVGINSFTTTPVYEAGSSIPVNYVNVVNTGKITYNVEERCDFNKVVVSIKFDNYPEETAWDLRDASMNVIASGGFNAAGDAITGYAALGFADQSTFTSPNYCLPGGQYTFTIYDDYGDGMYTSATVSGTYTVKLGTTVLASGGGDFGFLQETTFTLP
ncbi:hypothetical protein L1S35_00970 [Flavobacterium sp. AS60]|uniref:hypothetical protein n=1 Tax=Flavobacterium anseongense TaxID=2910677 RepID=UPI001F266FD6|nr:hypothetical protein [Flavobacterium sp. AS60]MCF6128226.1 hypothetical protein [Flavobacterium sp. AS60]